MPKPSSSADDSIISFSTIRKSIDQIKNQLEQSSGPAVPENGVYNVPSGLAEQYLETYAGISLRETTVNTYEQHLREYLDFLHYRDKDELLADRCDVVDYIEVCVERENRKSTIEGKLTTITEFYKFIHLRTEFSEQLTIDPLTLETINLSKYNTPPEIEREALTREELRRLFDELNSYRNRLMAVVAAETGLRNSDLRSIRVNDVDYDGLEIHVHDPKGGVPYDVPISQQLAVELETWDEKYRESWGPVTDSSYMFPSQTGEKITTNEGLNTIIKEAADRAGLQEVIATSDLSSKERDILDTNKEVREWHRVTVHTLRHTCITLMQDAGVSLPYRQLVGNHQSPETTRGYSHSQRKTFDEIRDQFDPPR